MTTPSEAIVSFCGKPKGKRINKKGRAEALPLLMLF